MAQFPTRETEIAALAETIIAGLIANPTVYPNPPYPPADMQLVLNSYHQILQELTAAQAQAELVRTYKDSQLGELVDKMKANLRYAENTVDYDDDELKRLGWGGPKAPTPLEPPGQARSLEAPRQGEGWVFLDWKRPVDGGKVASYTIQRRDRAAGEWVVAGLAIDTQTTLVNQERGTEWEYRVIAVNKAGGEMPSNTVMAVL